jgi:hypothetical protein
MWADGEPHIAVESPNVRPGKNQSRKVQASLATLCSTGHFSQARRELPHDLLSLGGRTGEHTHQ